MVENVVPAAVDSKINRCGSCGAAIGQDATKCDYCNSVVIRDKKRLSLICPECYSRNADESRYCTGCGVGFQPQALPKEAEALDCPCCQQLMQVRAIGGVAIQECPECNGLWVPGDQFDALVNKAIEAQKNRPTSGLAQVKKSKPFEVDVKVQYRKCPACKGHMSRKNFGKRSGVIVDWCSKDGTWLDADELEQIAAFIMRGGLQASGAASLQSTQPGFGMGRTAEQMEALMHAEKLMAEERAKQADFQLRRDEGRRWTRGRSGNTLGDLLEDLLGL
jgi:Zn-finger nucleic acid-binding protein/ribosomal protein L40E